MRYKIGDKVKIVEKDYTDPSREEFEQLNPSFVVTIIKDCLNGYYYVEEFNNCFWGGVIESLYTDPFDFIENRWEILDFSPLAK